MQDITFQTHIARRSQSIDLPLSNFLLPLFEAISNSIYAIGEPHPRESKISITVHRVEEQGTLLEQSDREDLDIIGFDIEDNGIGFNQLNYESFCTDSSPLKESTGGKGVGRFTWLKAFDSVVIESYFNENEKSYKRTILLDNQNQKSSIIEVEANKHSGARVSLKGFKTEYRRIKKFSPLCDNIIEHFFPYFYEKKMPQIDIVDGVNKESLNKLYEAMVSGKAYEENISIDGKPFKVLHLFHKKHINGAYKINLCAFQRFVSSKTLEEIDAWFTDLNGRTIDIDGESYYYSAFIFSKFLNEKVNTERTGFTIPDKTPSLMDVTTVSMIYSEIAEMVKKYLNPHIKEAQEAKISKVSKYIMNDAPVYSHLIGYMSEEFTKIPLTSSKEKIESELHKINYKFEKKLKKKGRELVKAVWEDSDDYNKINDAITDYVEKENAVGKSKLASYVIHRKSILHLLKKALSVTDDEKYHKEDFVHKIICPMGKMSTELRIDQHNLWVIDERLVYNSFLASDKQIKSMNVPSESAREPDIVSFFDNPMAYGEENSQRAGVILEFKKPMRNSYTMHDIDRDPILQIGNYSKKLQEGEAIDQDGRPLKPADRVYAYLICDITPKLKEILETYGFSETYDGEGYFLPYHRNFKCYIEVIPYTKLLADATHRNTILFEQLGIRAL